MIKRCIDKDKEVLNHLIPKIEIIIKKIEVLFPQSQSSLSSFSCLCVCWREVVAGLILVGKQETAEIFLDILSSRLVCFFFSCFLPTSNARGGFKAGFAGSGRWICFVTEGLGSLCGSEAGATIPSGF